MEGFVDFVQPFGSTTMASSLNSAVIATMSRAPYAFANAWIASRIDFSSGEAAGAVVAGLVAAGAAGA